MTVETNGATAKRTPTGTDALPAAKPHVPLARTLS